MNIARSILVVVFALSGTSPAEAQSLRDAGQPAEIPPGSFRGRQYVDSEGCVFVRAGIDGTVTWVPRVTRARRAICDQQPTLITARAPAHVASLPSPAASPVLQAQPGAVAPAPQPAPKSEIRAAPVMPRANPAPVHIPQAGGTSHAVRVMQPDPSTAPVAPRLVVRQQVPAAQEITIPDGYKRVWMNGRLAPQGVHRTLAGRAQMDMMWTQTVPRRLILTDTGRDMSGHYPGLIYPYTSYEQQRAAMTAPLPRAKVSASGQTYVQAGVYASRAQARQAAQRIIAAGLPALLGSMTRGGKRYSLLLSGPFTNSRTARDALAQVRGAGFGNARLR